MAKLNSYISVGFCKSYGDADFAVSMAVQDLTQAQMDELRAMLVVAIGCMEGHWSNRPEAKQIQRADESQASRSPYDANGLKEYPGG